MHIIHISICKICIICQENQVAYSAYHCILFCIFLFIFCILFCIFCILSCIFWLFVFIFCILLHNFLACTAALKAFAWCVVWVEALMCSRNTQEAGRGRVCAAAAQSRTSYTGPAATAPELFLPDLLLPCQVFQPAAASPHPCHWQT